MSNLADRRKQRQSRSKKNGGKPVRSLAALDIGAQMTVCLIAETHDDLAGLRVTGLGEQRSMGFEHGVVTNMGALERTIRLAIDRAEQMAGHNISSLNINIAGGDLQCDRICSQITKGMNEITAEDAAKAVSLAQLDWKESVAGQKREALHAVTLGYHIDGTRGISDPRGMYADDFGAELSIVSTKASILKNIKQCIARIGIDVEGITSSPFAASKAVLREEETESGAILIDMGAHTTSFCVYQQGHMQYASGTPYGGIHITRDIAKCLKTTLAAAEKAKARYGSAASHLENEDEYVDIAQLGDDGRLQAAQIARQLLNNVIAARAEEIFQLIKNDLDKSGLDLLETRQVVLTGGGSLLKDIVIPARKIFGIGVRACGSLSLPGLASNGDASPAYACAAGLLHWREYEAPSSRVLDIKTEAETRKFNPLLSWFKQNF